MLNNGFDIRATTMREQNRYTVYVMHRYTDPTGGIGCMGATTALEIRYKTKCAADTTTKMINEMIP